MARRFPPPWSVEELDAMLADAFQCETIRLLKRRSCGEGVLSCLSRRYRAGCDLVDCPQRRAGAGRPGIYDTLYAGRRLVCLAKDRAADRGQYRQAAGAVAALNPCSRFNRSPTSLMQITPARSVRRTHTERVWPLARSPRFCARGLLSTRPPLPAAPVCRGIDGQRQRRNQ